VNFKSLRGMRDILPEEIRTWQFIEETAKKLLEIYNFKEIRTPILELSELFLRSIGEESDIVEKEMYLFEDKKGRKIALRPEGTASVVRAYIQNALFNHPFPQKFYYLGPMFRYERPQKGRYRQFHQIGVEVFGISTPSVEAELLCLLKDFFSILKIEGLSFEINSLGCKKCRPLYKENLNSYLKNKAPNLCSDCKRRLVKNPLRVLDCKVSECREALKDNPLIIDYLCEDCINHLENLKKELKILEIDYVINPKIVRGLDYYTGTVFEVTTNMLGSQNAVAAGGRYDELVQLLGGHPTPAAGFAIGMERLVEICKQTLILEPEKSLVYIAFAGRNEEKEAKRLVRLLRQKGIKTEAPYEYVSLKNQLKKADRLGVKWVLIVGEEELKKGKYRWKNMKESTEGEAGIEDILSMLEEIK